MQTLWYICELIAYYDVSLTVWYVSVAMWPWHSANIPVGLFNTEHFSSANISAKIHIKIIKCCLQNHKIMYLKTDTLLPLSLLLQVDGMFTAQVPTLQDKAKGWAEFSVIPLLVVKSSMVSLLLLPQRPERKTNCKSNPNWIMPSKWIKSMRVDKKIKVRMSKLIYLHLRVCSS